MPSPLREFTLEAREHLAAFEQALLALESEPQAGLRGSHVDRALRVIHSLKGDAGFLGLMAIRDLAHAMETLLENSRREAGLPPAVIIETLLAARDQLAQLVEQPHHPPLPGWEALWQRLTPTPPGTSATPGVSTGPGSAASPGPPDPSLSPAPLPLHALAFRVDLTRLSRSAGDTLPEFLRAIARLGTLLYCRLEPPGDTLAAPLPDTPVWWSARLLTTLSAEELAARWPRLWTSAEIRSDDPRQVLAIDLDATCQTTGLTLLALLTRLAQGGGLANPRLEFTPTNFTAGLPLGPVWLHGERPAKVDPASWIHALRDIPPWQSQGNLTASHNESAPIVGDTPPPPAADGVSLASFQPSDPAAPRLSAGGSPSAAIPDPATGAARFGSPLVASSPPRPPADTDRPRVAAVTEGTSPRAGLQGGSTGHPGDDTRSAVASATPAGSLVATEPSRTEALRVRVDLLDRLVDLVGELTLIRNQALQAFDTSATNRALVQRLSGVTSQLQDAVLKTRLQPVGSLFGRFPRLIRDLSRQLGKQVELVTEGTTVELDKTVLELLSDPLNHLVRNSLDHGIESPDERLAAGKPATGRLTLAATPADGQVVLEIRDDGRGIDPARVRAKALALGWKTAAELDRLPTRDLLALVLQPGFSTARQVTEISGRGVGLDVVRTNVEQLDGSLTIDSVPGEGTAIRLRVPLTMAILPCLLVRVAGERFLIPQRDLEEIACLRPDGPIRIESAHRTEMYRLRGRLLPVVRYAQLLGLPPAGEPARPGSPGLRSSPAESPASSFTQTASPPESPRLNSSLAPSASAPSRGVTLSAGGRPAAGPESGGDAGPEAAEPFGLPALQHLLVVRARGTQFAIVVDEVLGTQEVVVKPLHPALRKLGIFGGAALLGDGQVALIASLEGIARHAGVLADNDDATGPASPAKPEPPAAPAPRDPREVHRVLLFESGPAERFALPLVQIRRLVSVDPSQIERIQGAEFLTVDGVSTRILSLDTVMNVSPASRQAPMFLLLPRFIPEPLGILASRIIDTDTLMVDLQAPPPGQPGILGTALIRDRMTLFLHLQHLREQVFGAETGGSAPVPGGRAERILLIDDTAFFREVVRRYLEAEGWQIETAADGNEGLERLTAGGHDLVICDIEMPGLDGWGVARRARELGWQAPLLALTSLSRAEHLARARACGFDEFEEKLDHDRLVATVRRMLANRAVARSALREESP